MLNISIDGKLLDWNSARKLKEELEEMKQKQDRVCLLVVRLRCSSKAICVQEEDERGGTANRENVDGRE